jgi:hypothetical protein
MTLAVVAAVAGCAGSRSPRPAAVSTQAARSELTSDAASLRIKWDLSSATYQLEAQCMKHLGFVYVTPDVGPEPSPKTITADALGSGRPATYGVTPEEFADPPTEPDWNRPGFSHALDGLSTQLATVSIAVGGNITYETGGCTAAARTELYGSVRAYVVSFYLPQVERDLFQKFTGTDQPYLSALHLWQACMKADHFPFTDPDDAAGSVGQLAGKVSAAELVRRQAATAEADTACDARSQLRRRTNLALGKFVDSLSPRILAELDDVARSQAAAYQVAQRLVSP